MMVETGHTSGENILIKGSNNRYLSDIKKIMESHIPIKDIKQIPLVVEPPLISTVTKLFHKKIETFMSSANIENGVWIGIYYDTLCEQDREIIDNLIASKVGTTYDISLHSGGRPVVTFSLPDFPDTPIEYIEKWGNRIADTLKGNTIQIRKKTYTQDEMKKILGLLGSNDQEVERKIRLLLLHGIIRYEPLHKLYHLKY